MIGKEEVNSAAGGAVIQAAPVKSGRLYSLDALRGADMLCIIGLDTFVQAWRGACPDNPILASVARQFGHVHWEGIAMYDLIFPLFLFISGVSLFLSLSRREGQDRMKLTVSLIKRGGILFLIGLIMNGLMSFEFSEIRYSSVLGLIGVAYALGGTAVIWLRSWWKILLAMGAVTLIVTGLQFSLGDFTSGGSINTWIDQRLIPGKLNGGDYDPEGLLGMFSASVLTMGGYLSCKFLKSQSMSPGKKVLVMLGCAAGILALAYGCGTFYPMIKKMWTGSFVWAACGWSLLALAVFHYLVDILGFVRSTFFFQVIGMNAIAIYVGQNYIPFGNIANDLFSGPAGLCGVYAGMVMAAVVIFLKWYILYWLKQKNITIKVG